MGVAAALHANRLAGRWLILALAAIGLSTLCALFLVVARAPFLGSTTGAADLFRSALVLHVGLAVVVWFLSCTAAFWSMLADADGAMQQTAFGLAVAGVGAMLCAPILGPATPILANYLPVLDSPVFLCGFACFLGGIAMSAACALPRMLAGRKQPLQLGGALSAVALLVAVGLLCATLAGQGLPHGAAEFEISLWGTGHVLQFVHVLLLMAAWSALAESVAGAAPGGRMLRVCLVVTALPLAAAPLIQTVYTIDSAEYRHAFTLLMAWGLWPAAAVLGLRILCGMARHGHAARVGARAALVLSVVLFLLGCLLGALIRTESTLVPAHYHGTVGAITLACMALGYRLLPAFGFSQRDGRMARWQPLVYGGGLVILVCGLAWSGWIGVPRKTPHAEIVAHYPAYYAAMGLAVVGGTMAVAGAALFVANMLRSLSANRTILRRAARIIAGTAVAAGLFGCAPEQQAPQPKLISSEAASHAAQRRQEEIDARFHEGAALLAAKNYEGAARALHRLLELAPDMPEAHVNMGYAMIGMQRYAVARDFFDTATNLRPQQANAYYGLALALEGLNDYGGALGAMRSFVHLNKDRNDPFLRKADSAIWEWEEALKKARSGTAGLGSVIPENGNLAIPAPASGKRPG